MLKNIGMVIILGGILFLAYTLFFPGEDPAETADVETVEVEDGLITMLRELESMTISRDIFSDRIFESLVDFSVPIPEEPVGRENPFAPTEESS
ncbi:hypothetical protein L0Y49_04105 [bacterium]|nr:hypothetical protein [bacterium]MCI0679954.1 hypothetical protein [bacterium]